MARNSGDAVSSEDEDDDDSFDNQKQGKTKCTIPIPNSIPKPVPQTGTDKSQITMGQKVVTPIAGGIVGSSHLDKTKVKTSKVTNISSNNNNNAKYNNNYSMAKGRTSATATSISKATHNQMPSNIQNTISKVTTVPVVLTNVPQTSSKTVLITAVPGESEGQVQMVRTVGTVDPILNPPPSITQVAQAAGHKRKVPEALMNLIPSQNQSQSQVQTQNPKQTSSTVPVPAKISKSVVKPCSVVIETQPQLEKLVDSSFSASQSSQAEKTDAETYDSDSDCQLITGDVDDDVRVVSPAKNHNYPLPSTSTSKTVLNPSVVGTGIGTGMGVGVGIYPGPSYRVQPIRQSEQLRMHLVHLPPAQIQNQIQPHMQIQSQHSNRFNLASVNTMNNLHDPFAGASLPSSTSNPGTLALPLSRSKFVTTKDQTVVEIVEEFNDNDPNIDIKYEPPFMEDDQEIIGGGGAVAESNAGTSVSSSSNQIQQTLSCVSSLLSNGERPPPPREVERRVINLQYRQSSTFDINWLFQMKKYQPNLMPYTMFIKRDEFRQWFEYLPNVNPALSRYRCRLCYKYLQTYGIPRSYWGPVESEQGQLKKTEYDNRNAINSHARKKSHLEVLRKLQMEGNPDAGFIDTFDKTTKKKLIDSINSCIL